MVIHEQDFGLEHGSLSSYQLALAAMPERAQYGMPGTSAILLQDVGKDLMQRNLIMFKGNFQPLPDSALQIPPSE
jgi:hypothetical protein